MAAGDVLILVADDDPTILGMLRDALEDGSFAVTTAAPAEDAVEQLERGEPLIRALVTDVDFRGSELTGWDVARRGRELVPGLPIVYMTGASANEWSANGVPGSVLLTKPFAGAQVVTAIAGLLNAASSNPAAPQ